jgi:hypothetical protein
LSCFQFFRDKADKRKKDSLGCNFDAPPTNGSSKHNNISVYQVDATTHQGKNKTHKQATYRFKMDLLPPFLVVGALHTKSAASPTAI